MNTDRSAAVARPSMLAARPDGCAVAPRYAADPHQTAWFGATRDDGKSSVEHTVGDQPFALIARSPAPRGEA